MKDFGQRFLGFIKLSVVGCMIYSSSSYSNYILPNFKDRGETDRPNNSYIDPRVNYEKFMGRVSDRDKSGRILKVNVENNNTKFFKAGDTVTFWVNRHKTSNPCMASVRNTEDFYFVIYVQDFDSCWPSGKYFPRGMQLNFNSKKLANRIFEASKFREILLLRKDGFLNQLNNINHYLWTYDQEKIKTAASFDEQINAIKRKKQVAIDNLLQTKQEKLLIQAELQKKLNGLDESISHYKVERQEYLLDRWNMDHDAGIGFPQRPMKMKKQ
jgi:hypothetical protein